MAVRSVFALLLVALPLPGCQTPVAPSIFRAPGRYTIKSNFGGEARTFILRIPKSFDGKSPMPVVFALHGWTSSGEFAERSWGMGDAAERNNFVLVAPDGLGDPRGWNVGFIDLGGKKGDDVGFIANILDSLPREVPVDPKRVYLVGHSNGAMLAHYAGAKLSDRVAAIVGVAGTIGLPTSTEKVPDPKFPVSALVVHGNRDEVVSFETSGRGLLRGFGARDTAAWWAKRDGAETAMVENSFDDGPLERWVDPKRRVEVEFLTINGAGHIWPQSVHPKGQTELPFTDFIWQFLKAHPKP